MTGSYEIWVQNYDTFSTGGWELHSGGIADIRVAEEVAASLDRWGTNVEVRAAPSLPEPPFWAGLSFEDFQAGYVARYGYVDDRDSVAGRRTLEQEAKERERRAMRETVKALPEIPRRRPQA